MSLCNTVLAECAYVWVCVCVYCSVCRRIWSVGLLCGAAMRMWAVGRTSGQWEIEGGASTDSWMKSVATATTGKVPRAKTSERERVTCVCVCVCERKRCLSHWTTKVLFLPKCDKFTIVSDYLFSTPDNVGKQLLFDVDHIKRYIFV